MNGCKNFIAIRKDRYGGISLNKQLLGVVDATAYFQDLAQLISHRSLSALPFGGKYRLIDFILSNMVNSGIESVAIFTNAPYCSLLDHVGSGENWDLNRKRDGLFLFPVHGDDYQGIGTFDRFAVHIDFLLRSSQEYAVIANCYTIANIDFQKTLTHHLKSGCDITEIRKDGLSLNMYVLKTSLLISLIETRKMAGYANMSDVIADMNGPYRVGIYEYEEPAVMIDSIRSYYAVSMALLKKEMRTSLFKAERPIYTRVTDEPPTCCTKECTVTNSLMANGCRIEGIVENSVIFSGVKIEKGAVVRNSIIMQGGVIEADSHLDGVILDKNVTVKKGTVLTGSKEQPYVIGKGMIVLRGAVMKA